MGWPFWFLNMAIKALIKASLGTGFWTRSFSSLSFVFWASLTWVIELHWIWTQSETGLHTVWNWSANSSFNTHWGWFSAFWLLVNPDDVLIILLSLLEIQMFRYTCSKNQTKRKPLWTIFSPLKCVWVLQKSKELVLILANWGKQL